MGREKARICFTYRMGSFFIATLGSLYFSEIMKFEPCVLCWYQRIFMYPFVLWLGIAVAKKIIASQVILYQLQVLVLVFLYITMQFKSPSVFSRWSVLRSCTLHRRIYKLVWFYYNPVFSTYRLYYNRCL